MRGAEQQMKEAGPSYPRQYGDVPYAAGVGSVGALPEGHYSPAAAQLEPELTLGVEGQRRAPVSYTHLIVTHIEPFGAFCDVGCGISALLPIDCMSVSRISSPADRVS